MEQKEEPIIFNNPKNFKNGKYLFTKYRIRDFVFLIATAILTTILISAYLTATKKASPFILMILLIPILLVSLLTMPAGIYHCVYEWINLVVEEFFSKKQYISFKQEEKEDEVENELI